VCVCVYTKVQLCNRAMNTISVSANNVLHVCVMDVGRLYRKAYDHSSLALLKNFNFATAQHRPLSK